MSDRRDSLINIFQSWQEDRSWPLSLHYLSRKIITEQLHPRKFWEKLTLQLTCQPLSEVWLKPKKNSYQTLNIDDCFCCAKEKKRSHAIRLYRSVWHFLPDFFLLFSTHPPPFTFSKEFIDTSKHFLSKKQSLKNRRRKRSMIKKREDELIDFSWWFFCSWPECWVIRHTTRMVAVPQWRNTLLHDKHY